MEKAKGSRWFLLAVGILVLMFAGIIYAWSNLSSPLGKLGWADSALTFNYTLTIWFFCIGGLVSGFLSKKLSPAVRLAASGVMLFAGFFLTSCLQEGSSIGSLYLGYGFLAGTGIGVVYNTVIATLSRWFPDRKGLCTGALMMGFGIGSFLIGLVAANLMKSGAMEWRGVYRLLGGLSGAAMLLGALFLKAPPQSASPAKAVSAGAGSGDYTAAQMIRRASFWKLFIFFILFSAVGSSALALCRKYAVSLGSAEGTAILVAAVVSVTNSLGRLASGALCDSLGLAKTKYITSGVVIAAPLLALIGTASGSAVLGVIGLLLCGFSYGFSPTVSAAFTAEFYGAKDFALNLSIINLVLIPGAFVPTIASSILSSSGGSYVPVFAMLTVFSLVGLGLIRTVKRA